MVMMIRITETMALMRKISMRNMMRNHNLVTSPFHLPMTAMMVMVMTIAVIKVVMITIMIEMMIQ